MLSRARGGGGRRPNRQNRNRPNRRGGSGGRGGRRTGDWEPPPPVPPPGRPGRERHRELITVGAEVYAVKKEDQRTGGETRGVVARVLTNAPYHPRGIKVKLASGEVGRVTRFVAAATTAAADAELQEQVLPSFATTAPPIAGGGGGHEQVSGALATPNVDVHFEVDDCAFAALVGEMDFDAERAREALQMFDNNVERAVVYLLRQGS